MPKHGDRKVQVQSPSGCMVLTGCGKGVGDKTGKVLWDQHCKDFILRSLRRKIPTCVTICLYFYFFKVNIGDC